MAPYSIDSDNLAKIRAVMVDMPYKDWLLFGELVMRMWPEALNQVRQSNVQQTLIDRFFGWSLEGDLDNEVLALFKGPEVSVATEDGKVIPLREYLERPR
jgi:hypothetical protein